MKLNLFFLIMVLFALSASVQAQITIGSVNTPEKAALLDLKTQTPNANNVTSDKGGLLLSRVALEDLSTLEPFIENATADEKLSHTGLIVYNVKVDETANLVQGLYYWTGEEWMKMLSEFPSNSVSSRNLVANALTNAGDVNFTGGTVLNFGSIVAPEDGSYAFCFRLYGTIAGFSGYNQRGMYYFKAYAGGRLEDSAEINIYSTVTSGTNTCTYSITMAVNARRGESIVFRLNHNTNFAWTLIGWPQGDLRSARTSMVWWKL